MTLNAYGALAADKPLEPLLTSAARPVLTTCR